MATVGPAAVQHWAGRLAEQQVVVVDAPVSGGVARAAGGDLLGMVGGSQTAVERVQPLLERTLRLSGLATVETALRKGRLVRRPFP